jgi:hypothetical protein
MSTPLCEYQHIYMRSRTDSQQRTIEAVDGLSAKVLSRLRRGEAVKNIRVVTLVCVIAYFCLIVTGFALQQARSARTRVIVLA